MSKGCLVCVYLGMYVCVRVSEGGCVFCWECVCGCVRGGGDSCVCVVGLTRVCML